LSWTRREYSTARVTAAPMRALALDWSLVTARLGWSAELSSEPWVGCWERQVVWPIQKAVTRVGQRAAAGRARTRKAVTRKPEECLGRLKPLDWIHPADARGFRCLTGWERELLRHSDSKGRLGKATRREEFPADFGWC
jgi:hypothetical protein